MSALLNLIPRSVKESLKDHALAMLHAEREITSAIATKVVRDGVSRSLNWEFQDEKKAVLAYLDAVRVDEFSYKFCQSVDKPTLYCSIYACMLFGLFGELEDKSRTFRDRWLKYLDLHQSESDGYFRDPVLAGPAFEGRGGWGAGWGMLHLAGHIIIAYARLGGVPKYKLKFLEPFYSGDLLEAWLRKQDLAEGVWNTSAHVMNNYVLLQYARDFMEDKRAEGPVKRIADWLLESQSSSSGMWHKYEIKGYPEIGDAIRGAYHFYPLFNYEGQDVPYADRAIDTILKSQNSWGGFEAEKRPSGACEDIDAIEPLVRFAYQTGYRKHEVDMAVKRAFVWINACRNEDGGYVSLPLNGCHYGDHPLTTSAPGESNLFATWFRSLCLAYVTTYLGIDNSYIVKRIPGYEISLVRE